MCILSPLTWYDNHSPTLALSTLFEYLPNLWKCRNKYVLMLLIDKNRKTKYDLALQRTVAHTSKKMLFHS